VDDVNSQSPWDAARRAAPQTVGPPGERPAISDPAGRDQACAERRRAPDSVATAGASLPRGAALHEVSVTDVVLVRTGVANLASVLAALQRLGVRPEVTTDAARVAAADAAILPGVGAFGAGVAALREHGLDTALRARVAAERPLLAVCLGLQLLASTSDETPGVTGLGLLDAHVARFPDTVKVPQLGWNQVVPDDGCTFLAPGYAYFANSFRLVDAPAGWRAARADHGGPFVAALERGPILACQFHPELSGPWGLALLDRWLAAARTGAPTC